MKTSIRYSWIYILAMVLVSCQDTGVRYEEELSQTRGSVKFSFSKASAPSEVYWIVAKLEHAIFPSLTDSVSVAAVGDTAQLHIQSIRPGTWWLTVEAKDSSGVVLYNGAALIDIHGGQVTVANITMNSTFGELEINIIWPTSGGGTWEVYANNPVLEQTPGGFDADYFFLMDPKVLKVDGVYQMWYTGGYNEFAQGVGVDTTWIEYATSTDGITWTKHGRVLYPGLSGSWNAKGVIHPAVLYDNGMYKMWFGGNSATEFGTGIGYAESNDGITWDVSPELVITADVARPQLRHPEVLKKDGVYYLYYNAGTFTSNSLEVYLKTSTDGEQWIDRGNVLAKRNSVSWETQGVGAPSIIVEQGKYKMFYTGFTASIHSIGYAESIDGVHWLNRSAEPVLTPTQALPWSITYASYPAVLRDGNILKMWFSGLSQVPYRWEIGYAEQD